MGYVYLIGAPTFGWYKIGKSATPEVRVKDLGILLPFKLSVISVWKAENHHLMEKTLHEMYADHRINGEWFEFKRPEINELVSAISSEARVYPGTLTECLERFSNIVEDTRNNKRVIGVRVQKHRGNFTDEERNEKRLAAMEQQRLKRLQKQNT